MNSACPRRVSLITALGTAGHSVSNHLRVDRGSPGCQRVYPRRDRLRLSLADSPTHADRIEFTAAACLVSLCYGLVVLVPLLSTSHCYDAVTVRYRTASHRTGADFHRSIPPPSQAHERGLSQPAAGARAEDRSITLTSIRQRFCCGLRQAALRVKILRFFAPLHLCVFAL